MRAWSKWDVLQSWKISLVVTESICFSRYLFSTAINLLLGQTLIVFLFQRSPCSYYLTSQFKLELCHWTRKKWRHLNWKYHWEKVYFISSAQLTKSISSNQCNANNKKRKKELTGSKDRKKQRCLNGKNEYRKEGRERERKREINKKKTQERKKENNNEWERMINKKLVVVNLADEMQMGITSYKWERINRKMKGCANEK